MSDQPVKWEVFFDSRWLVWEEQLAPDRWLLCFKPAGNDNPYATKYWVNVRNKKWEPQEVNMEYLEEHTPPDELTLLCVMHEMRKKYGGISDDR